MHSLFDGNLFNKEIEIVSQYVKIIQLQTPLGGDINLNSDNLELIYNYDILDNKEDLKNHIVLVEFRIIEKNSEDEDNPKIALAIVVEGIYNVNSDVDKENIKIAKHYGSLNLTVNYLRTVFFNITSLTSNGGQFLPLINISELHSNRDRLQKEKKKKTSKNVTKTSKK